MTNVSENDGRRVVLIKSLATNNRFYTLVDPARGIRNADTVASIPADLTLGIAYPCLEDGLNDFAVIRTTFETLDLFDSEDPIRDEMMEIINDARGNLIRRLMELRDKISERRAHFLGTDYNEFKTYVLDISTRGYRRRDLDSMMKLNVFSSVAEAEGYNDPSDLPYKYEFSHGLTVPTVSQLEPRIFIVTLFDDVLRCVQDDANYQTKYLFDRNVFQKFIAVMFVNYATTDPIFYGINKRDYGVSGDKEMDSTPLYLAIGKELRAIEESVALESATTPSLTPQPAAQEGFIMPEGFVMPEGTVPGDFMNDEMIMGTLTSLCSAARQLLRKNDPETKQFAQIILADASKVFGQLKQLGILSSFAVDPGTNG
jgi:hypothetical protein